MDENTPQNTEEREHATTPRSSGGMRGVLMVVLVLLVMAGAFWAYTTFQSNAVVATVNGEEITRAEYENTIRSISNSPTQQGAEAADIEAQALQALIDRALIIDAAEASDVEVSDEDVDARISEIQSQVGSEEAFQQELRNLGLSEDDFREEVRTQLLVEMYVEANLPEGATEVSDEEVQSAYDSYVESVGGAENAPSFEEVAPTLRSQLVNVRTEEAVQGILEELRAEADIEVHIDNPAETPSLPQGSPQGEELESTDLEVQEAPEQATTEEGTPETEQEPLN